MRYIFSILTIFLFTGATNSPVEKSLIFPRSFFLEMKKLEKPGRVQAFSKVQGACNYTGSGTSITVTISSTSTNNLVVVYVFVASTTGISSVTDSGGNTYANSQNISNGSFRIAQYYAFQSSSSTSVTMTFASSTGGDVIVEEFSGFTGTPTNAECFDVSNGTYGSAGNCEQTTAINPINSQCLITGSFMDDNNNMSGGAGGYTAGTAGCWFSTSYHESQYKTSSLQSEINSLGSAGGAGWINVVTSFKQENAVSDWPAAGKAIRSAGN